MRFPHLSTICLVLATAILVACTEQPAAVTSSPIYYTAEIVKEYPHNSESFCQGLYFEGKEIFIESSGKYNKSFIARYDLATNKLLTCRHFDQSIFAEGVTILGEFIYMLTWESGKIIVLNREHFATVKTLAITGEGWGLTNNGKELIMSDGSAELSFIDSKTGKVKRSIIVVDENGDKVVNLNELEYIDGLIYVNIWRSNSVIAIDPQTGCIEKKIDMSALAEAEKNYDNESNVLNGIAYLKESGNLLLTGKYWTKIFEVRLNTKK